MNNIEEKFEKLLDKLGGIDIKIATMSEQLKSLEKVTLERIQNQQSQIQDLARRVDKHDANIRWVVLAIMGYVITRLLGLL